MRIRVTRSHGQIRWVVDFLDGKNRRRRRFFKTQDEAATFSHGITSGTKQRGRTGPAVTIFWLFNKYLIDTQLRRGSQAQKVINARLQVVYRVLRDMGILRLPQLNNDAHAALVGALRGRGLSEHTVFDYVASLKSVARWAIEQELLSPRVLTGMVLPTPQRGRERFLSKGEIDALLAHLQEDPLRLPAALGIYQGLRRAEVCGLRSEHIEMAENRLTIAVSKNRDWRTIQLHPSLLPYMPDPLPADHICRNDAGSPWTLDWMTHRMRAVLNGLGPAWADVSFHTLRHTCASQMAASGKYTLYQIAKFLGHRTIQTTQKYAHLLPEQVRPDW